MLTKIILLSLICSLLSVILKPVKAEYSVFIGIAFAILFIHLICEPLAEIFSNLTNFSDYIKGGDEIIKQIFKIIIVAYATEIASEISKSAGEVAIAKKVEIAGRIYAAQLVLPIFTLLMDVIRNVF